MVVVFVIRLENNKQANDPIFTQDYQETQMLLLFINSFLIYRKEQCEIEVGKYFEMKSIRKFRRSSRESLPDLISAMTKLPIFKSKTKKIEHENYLFIDRTIKKSERKCIFKESQEDVF